MSDNESAPAPSTDDLRKAENELAHLQHVAAMLGIFHHQRLEDIQQDIQRAEHDYTDEEPPHDQPPHAAA